MKKKKKEILILIFYLEVNSNFFFLRLTECLMRVILYRNFIFIHKRLYIIALHTRNVLFTHTSIRGKIW